MPKTKKRAQRQGEMARFARKYMQKFDKTKTGTLNRDEVKELANSILTEFTPLVGGLTEEDVDMIMMCGGDTVQSEIREKDIPIAVGIMGEVKEVNKEFHELFLKYDTNKSGSISPDKFLEFFKELNAGDSPSMKDVLFIIRRLEPRGKDDPIDEKSLRAALACWYILRPSPESEIKAMFQSWDTTKSGTITRQEFQVVMKGLNKDFTDSMIEALFKAADTKKTGYLDYDEFVDFIFEDDNTVDSTVPKSGNDNEDRTNVGKWSSGELWPGRRGDPDDTEYLAPAPSAPTADEEEKLKRLGSKFSTGGGLWCN